MFIIETLRKITSGYRTQISRIDNQFFLLPFFPNFTYLKHSMLNTINVPMRVIIIYTGNEKD